MYHRRVSALGGQLSLGVHLWDDGRSGGLSLPHTRIKLGERSNGSSVRLSGRVKNLV